MQRLLSILIVVLALTALGVFAIAAYGQFQLLRSPDLGISQRFLLLPGIAVSAGVLIAALAFIRDKSKADLERRRHVSEVLLEQASAGLKTAVELLSDQNNTRITWIRAARTLLQAQQLGAKIEAEEYKVAYRLQEERARNELYQILTIQDPQTGGRQPLPPQFFYGITNWRDVASLDDAAKSASQRIEAFAVTIDAVPPAPALLPLADRSVVAIYSFVEYPRDYDDPLKAIQVWGREWDRSLDIDQGARRYIAHTQLKFAINGELHDQPPRAGA